METLTNFFLITGGFLTAGSFAYIIIVATIAIFSRDDEADTYSKDFGHPVLLLLAGVLALLVGIALLLIGIDLSQNQAR